ncbi:MAG: histidine phosphatase family protein [Bacteroidales bacterium]|nr:histidine phosphatase family protein [Bacteroidales bacterium]MDT8431573.1 histidine phosphatase family protein [Bacteroidales bacterium]
MQRKLFIIRHGKSSWDSIVSDIDRPLTERGVKNSYEMAALLVSRGQVPELVISSPANRALHTAVIMARSWELNDHRLLVRKSLYLPGIEDIAETLSEVDDTIASVAVFGHNPGFTQFANRFLEPQVDNVPTAGAVVVTMELGSWNDISAARVVDAFFGYPKKIK